MVVIATGLSSNPYVPTIPGSDQYKGVILHSWDIKDIDSLRNMVQAKRVLIVGSGNSAAELAHSCHTCGAADINMLVNAPRLVF